MRNSPYAKSVRNIECLCFWNWYGFQVGTRYLTLRRVDTHKSWRLEITGPIAARLESIADMYPADDANRTYAIFSQIFEQFHPKFNGEA